MLRPSKVVGRGLANDVSDFCLDRRYDVTQQILQSKLKFDLLPLFNINPLKYGTAAKKK